MSLTNLTSVKAFRNITANDHDAEILRLIPVVDAFIMSYCNRASLELAATTEFQSGKAGQTIVRLLRYPVASITSVHDDPDRVYGADTLINPTDYVLADAQAGILVFDKVTLHEGFMNLKIVYSAGYAEGSLEKLLLEQAAVELLWLARLKGDQALLGLQSRSIADGRVDTLDMDWPAGAREILDQFKKFDH